MIKNSCILFILLQILNISSLAGLIHNLQIRDDARVVFKIETFGFIAGGLMNITVSDFSLVNQIKSSNEKIGFLARKASSESAAQQDLQTFIDNKKCIFDYKERDDFIVNLTDSKLWSTVSYGHVIKKETIGLYTLLFARCNAHDGDTVNFNLKVIFQNPGPNYLSAGDSPLPLLYFCFFILFSVVLVVWTVVLYLQSANGTVHRIHFMMAALLVLKCLTLLVEGIRLHYISLRGSSETWSAVYYVLSGLKGFMLFTVLLLIGSGWSLMKPFLHMREKRVIMVVLALQILSNLATVVLDETAPGSMYWLAWRDVLHAVDVACCVAVLVPIVWSIRHLKQAADSDGKAHSNLTRLRLFRHFYITVIVYVYFTRIVVLLLASTIPFQLLWTSQLLTELATCIFFVLTGYQFRPFPENPYLLVRTEESTTGRDEFGLEEDAEDIELTRR